MISSIISRIVILVFGTLYPAYASYKAVRTKNVREYVKWMMYWIVFALFTCGETFTDLFFSWFPFYYEIKIVLVIWLLSPATKGSSILYRKFVHPALTKREQEIDDYISKAKEQGYHTVLNLGTKGVNYATNVLMQTAIKGGGGLVQQLKKSYSLSDLTGQEEIKMSRSDRDEADDVITDPRIVRRNIAASRRYSPRRSASESNTRQAMYFPEVDLDINRNARPTDIRDSINLNHIRSSEDVSSGYSSADNSAARDLSLMRSTSVSGSTRSRTRQLTTISRVTTIKRPPAAEGSDVIIEEVQDSDALQPYFNPDPRILDLPPSYHLSETDPPFIFQIINNRMKIIEILDYPFEFDSKERQSSSDSEFLDTVDNIKNTSDENTNLIIVANANSDISVDVTLIKNDPTITSDINSPIIPSVISSSATIGNYNVIANNVSTSDNTVVLEIKDDVSKMLHQIPDELISDVNDKIYSLSFDPGRLNTDLNIPKAPSVSSINDAGESLRITLNNSADSSETLSITLTSDNYDDSDGHFVTPGSSPEVKRRKSRKGKYGKKKAPPPPAKSSNEENDNVQENCIKHYRPVINIDNKKDMPNIVDNEPTGRETKENSLQVLLSPNIKKKRKLTSPHSKRSKNQSPISKLMQIPSKFAFWHKHEDSSKKDASTSSSSSGSRRSSIYEDSFEKRSSAPEPSDFGEFGSATDLQSNNFRDVAIPTTVLEKELKGGPKDLDQNDGFNTGETSKDTNEIIEKGFALQRLMEGKLSELRDSSKELNKLVTDV